MEIIDQIIQGMSLYFTFKAVLMVGIGVAAGILVGAIPGISGVMATAILVPFSFFMPPTEGIPFLLGLHKGALFGDSIPAILINTPGQPAAAATALDGYPLAKKGEAKSGIQMALVSSTIGDTFSDIVLILAAVPLAALALKFGPAEFFALMLMGLTIIGGITGSSAAKGILSALIGIMIGLVGFDAVTGAERYTFGIPILQGGVGTIPLMIGLFAVSEVLIQAEKSNKLLSKRPDTAHLKGGKNLKLKEIKASARTIIRSSILGTIIGAIPGTGAAIATFIGYGAAKRASKKPEEFGKGSYEGVAASEAANSAVAGADLIPTLTLGIPGSATAAILMGAFLAQGLRPGPELFEANGATMYAIFALLLIGNPIMIVVGWVLTPIFARVVTVRQSLLVPAVLLLCLMGVYVYRGNLADIQVALIVGVFGYLLRKIDIPLAPLVIAFIITPIAERSMKQALILSDGDFSVFLTRPISAGFLLVALAILYFGFRRKTKNKKSE
ncbi:MAG: tripartite tricarboxylate transporter permease [Rhodospirillales bacterium]|nr:tripartite tricarboxylate transporter permease [Rhodospirillales bacterium]